MMPDDFRDDEVQELLGEIRIQMSIPRQMAKPFDLVFLACRVGRRQIVFGLQEADFLGAAETLGQHMHERGIDIVDRLAVARKLVLDVLFDHFSPHFFLGRPGRPGKPPPNPGRLPPGSPGIPPPGRPGIEPGLRPAASACFWSASSCFGSSLERSGIPPRPPIAPPMPPRPILPARPPIICFIMPPLPLPPMAFIMSAIWRCIFKSLLISAASVPEPAAMRFL